MRAVRLIWGTAVALVAAVAFLGVSTVGAASLLGACLGLASLGLVVGLAWTDGPGRWVLAGRWTLWSGLAGLLMVGLPIVVGPFALIVLLLLAATSPVLVEHWWSRLRERRPVLAARAARRLSDRDLHRRWSRTSEDLCRPRAPASAALRLVQEREVLLTEIERRDPAGFEARLVHAGWHSAHPAADL